MFFNRTFHPDEANQAFTTGNLLETGMYRYNPSDHHGPVLYYAAAPIQKMAGHTSTAELDGSLLRMTPLVFALLTLVFGAVTLARMTSGLKSRYHGIGTAFLFTALLATAPIFAFFSTFFIQEALLGAFLMLLVFGLSGYVHAIGTETTATVCRSSSSAGRWCLLTGVAAGLAFATKETSVIAFAAFGAAGLCVAGPAALRRHWNTTHFLLTLFAALLTAVLFFSSFGTSFQGVFDAFIAMPSHYLHRAAGDAVSDGAHAHVHAWWWYLKVLFLPDFGAKALTWSSAFCMPWPRTFRRALMLGWRFTELPLFLLCLTPFAAALFRNGRTVLTSRAGKWFLFLFSAALFQLIIYSVIPYKTPWCLLTIVECLSLAAAVGTSAVITHFRLRFFSAVILAFALFAGPLWTHCRGLSYMRRVPDGAAIPYNYANASYDVRNLADAIRAALRETSESTAYVAAILPRDAVWPLPWYLRTLSDRTGYWTVFSDFEKVARQAAPAVIVTTPENVGALEKTFTNVKQIGLYAIRPGVLVMLFSMPSEDKAKSSGKGTLK